jgi:hypothetical protein
MLSVEPGDSLPCSQEPAARSYTAPGDFNSRLSTVFLLHTDQVGSSGRPEVLDSEGLQFESQPGYQLSRPRIHDFPRPLQGKYGIVPQIMPQPLSCMCYPIRYTIVTMSLDAVRPDLTVSLNKP